MSHISNLRIKTELGELIYKEASDLNLSFSRIVDDFSDISNRFGDFSYEFVLPIVKENSLIFGSPEAIGSKNFFIRNRNISCQVFNNNQLILDGVINLEGITKDTYKCKFYSKFKELIDTLNEKTSTGADKTLKDLNFPILTGWTYETSIRDHINAGYKNSDETFYQYPLSFYSTFYAESDLYAGLTDYQGNTFDSDRPRENYYYLLNTVAAKTNRLYFHQIPPAVYIVSIVEQILEDAGWRLGGQFFNDANIKKIILLYSGEDDIYDQAISGEDIYTGTTENLQIARFLPDMGQAEFLKAIINCFNLYFRIDINNKIVEFETYETYFKNTDDVDPYDITYKINEDSGSFTYLTTNNPTITFEKALNRNIFGDNMIMTGATDNATSTSWTNISNTRFNQVFNRVGYTEQQNNMNLFGTSASTIEIPFSEPTIKRHFIWNDYDVNDVSQSAEVQNVYLPLISKQSIADNNSVKFNKKDTDTYLYNNESTIKFQGKGSLMYYYGDPATTFENKSGKGALKNYLYYNLYFGATRYNMSIPIVSPFQLSNYRDDIESWLTNITSAQLEDRRTSVASYLQSIWQMMGTATGVTDTTDFSLVFDDNGYFHETLWSKFHKYKWDRYQQSELFSGDMMMNSYDWSEMQINRPLRYKGELYSLVSIQGYNPITQRCQLTMIKKL